MGGVLSPFMDTQFAIGIDGSQFNQPLHVWINDGLMALFFFVIAFELKREFMAGELSTIKKAGLPMMDALGGMIVPAAIYSLQRVTIKGNLPKYLSQLIPFDYKRLFPIFHRETKHGFALYKPTRIGCNRLSRNHKI